MLLTPKSSADEVSELLQTHQGIAHHRLTAEENASASFQETIITMEHLLLKTISVFLILHGLLFMYEEIVAVFYIFPYLPTVFSAQGYSESIFVTLLRKTSIISITALLQTIYAVFVLTRFKHLAHRFHLFVTIFLLVLSWGLQWKVPRLEEEALRYIPTPPTVHNLLTTPGIEAKLALFQNWSMPAKPPSLKPVDTQR